MHEGLISDLEAIAGPDNVSQDQGDIDRYSGDALGTFRAFHAAERLSAEPAVVVWPLETAHVSQILKYAQRNQVPVVPYGGGTGVMGAATPVENCILLNMQRMNSIHNIDIESMSVEIGAGAILENAAYSMAQKGLVLGHDPWSRPIASIGGAISTNGMGYMAAKYGSMGEQVLGVEAVMPDGEIVQTRSVPKPSYGPSLNHLFIGAEGTFGVITKATIKGFPVPEKQVLKGFDFPDFESGFSAIAQMYAEGVRPTMVDYGEESWDEPISDDEEATVYFAFSGFVEDVEAHLKRTADICKRFGARDSDPGEVRLFWKTRHASGERFKTEVIQNANPAKARRERFSRRMDYLHVALPVSSVLEYRRRCKAILTENEVSVREWSIWGRPEFFSFLISEEGDADSGPSEHLGGVVDNVLMLAQQMGGTMEYCHGVGVKFAHLMGSELGNGYWVVRKMKAALDPGNILNPGKLTG